MNLSDKKNINLIEQINIFVFQLAVIVNSVLGFESQYYIVSKAIILIFFATMLLQIIPQKKLHVGTNVWISVAFMLLSALSCFWAVDAARSLSQLETQWQLYVLFIFTYLLFLDKKISLKKYLDALYLSGIFLVAYTIYRYGLVGFFSAMSTGERMGRLIMGENVFGMILSQAAIVAFYYFLKTKKWYHIISIAVLVVFSLSSGSKKAFLMLPVAIVCICLFEYGFRRIWKALLIGGVCIIALFILLQLPLFSTISERLWEYFNGGVSRSDIMREKLREAGWTLFNERPIFGYGIDNFSTVSEMGVYAHDNFVEIATGMGVVGLLLYYIPYLSSSLKVWTQGMKKGDYFAVLFFVITLIQFVFGYGYVQFTSKDCWMFLGVMVAMSDRDALEEIYE